MTTTTLSEKSKTGFSQGFAIYRWTLKKNLKLLIAYIVLLFLTLPMIQLLNRFGGNEIFNTENQKLFISGIYGSFFSFIVVVYTLICGMVLFSYLHNKRTTDLFCSLPVSRRVQFFARFLSAFTLVWVPMALVTVISAIICSMFMPACLIELLKGFLWLTLSMLVNLSVLAFLAVCAGSVTDVIVSYIAISIAWPLIIFLMYLIPGVVIPGAVIMENYNAMLLCAFSPFLCSFVGVAGYNASAEAFLFVLWWLILSAVSIFGCFLLIKRRKNESAQSVFAFTVPQIIIRVLCNFISGVVIGYFFSGLAWQSGNVGQLIWFCVGAVFGSFAAHSLLQLIYKQRFKGFVRSLIYYGISIAAVLVFVFSLVTGFFGADVYVPQAKDVDSAELYVTLYIPDESTNNGITNKTLNIKLDLKTLDEIERLQDVHRAVTQKMKMEHAKPYPLIGEINIFEMKVYMNNYYNMYDSQSRTNIAYGSIGIRYKLKGSGNTLTRFYSEPIEAEDKEAYEAIEELLEYTDGIKRSMGIYRLPGGKYYDESENLRLSYANLTIGDDYIPFDDIRLSNIAQALRMDLDEKGTDFVRYLSNEYYASEPFFTLYYSSDNADSSDCIQIDESFTHTIEVLKEYGSVSILERTF